MARAPRVFTWSDGLHAYTVATSSKVKALAAWGVTRDLFKDGEAQEILEGADVEAAIARPGEVIRSQLAVSAPEERVKTSKTGRPARPAPVKPSKAQVARANALKREIAGLEREGEALETEVAARRARLEREADERREALRARRAEAEQELAQLQKDWKA